MNQTNSASDDPLVELLHHFQKPLPLPTSLLQKQYESLPMIFKTSQLLFRLQHKNKQLIEHNFQELVHSVCNVFPTSKDKFNLQSLKKEVQNVFFSYPHNGHLYCESMKKLDPNHVEMTPFLRSVLQNMADTHCLNFQLKKGSEKLAIIIDQAMKRYSFRMGNSEGQGVIQAEENADFLRTCLIKIEEGDDDISELQSEAPSQLSQKDEASEVKKESFGKRYLNKITGFTKKAYNKAVNFWHKGQRSDKEKIEEKTTILKPGKEVKKLKKLKGKIKKAFNYSIYRQMSFEQLQILKSFNESITPNTIQQVRKQPYITKMLILLENQMKQIKQKEKFTQLYNPILNELTLANNSFKVKVKENKKKHFNETQELMIVLMNLYRYMQDKYDPARRRILQNIFNSFNQNFLTSGSEALRWLENNNLKNQQKNQTVETQAKKLLNHINTYRQSFLSSSTLSNIPMLNFVQLSNNLPERKVVNIFVSGFLSQDTDKKQEWIDLVNCMPDCEIYAIQWESDTITNLVKFFMFTCKDLIVSKKMAEQLKKKFVDNPFNPAFEEAHATGRYLAELLARLFPNKIINIYGYSLGTQVIKEFMKRMIEIGKEHLLNKIYLMGGVSDTRELQEIMQSSKYPLCLYNCYTIYDTVLRYLLSLCQPQIVPIGLNAVKEIQRHSIINVDCTNFISGHLAFRRNLDILGKILETHRQ